MEGLVPALDLVLGHAVAALECEDRGDPHQSLQEYNSAWCALSYALQAHGVAATTSYGRLPELVQETCAVLLETYSTRYEAIRTQLAAGSCSDGRESDVVRPVQSAEPTASSSGYPATPCSGGAAAAADTSVGPQQLKGTPHDIPAADAVSRHTDDVRDHGGANLHLRCSRDESRRPPTPADVSGLAGSGDAADGAGPGSFGGGSADANGISEGRPGASAAAPVMTELMSEVYQMCHRRVQEGSTLDDLAGLGLVKEEVRLALLLPLQMPHLFQGIRQPARNFLLYGPPGTGKTMLVERIAAEAGATLLVLTPGAVLSKWSGESEKQLRAVFDVARAMQPCIVFMDEVDSLAPTRGSGDDPIGRRLLNELLVQMSCLASGVAGPGTAAPPAPRCAAAGATAGACGSGSGGGAGFPAAVYVFAATNRIQDCDPALLRRFDRRVAVPLPDLAAREALLEDVLAQPEVAGHVLGGEEVRQLAERTEGYSGSDLAQLCREAAMQPVRELLREMSATGSYGGRGGAGRRFGSKAGVAIAAAGAAAGGGSNGGLQAGPRPLAMRDFEWALGAVLPAVQAGQR